MNSIAYSTAPVYTTNTTPQDTLAHKDSTYELVCKVAYLISVPKRIFENEHKAQKLDIYEPLEKDIPARIVRNLCVIHTSIERNFKYINDKMQYEFRTLLSLPEYVP